MVKLDDVVLLIAIEVLQRDAALEASCDLAHIVLKALQTVGARLDQLLAAAQDPHLIVAMYCPVEDHAACDITSPRDAEDLTNFGVTVDDIAKHRLEHALERLFDVLDQVVDHAVIADLDAFELS